MLDQRHFLKHSNKGREEATHENHDQWTISNSYDSTVAMVFGFKSLHNLAWLILQHWIIFYVESI